MPSPSTGSILDLEMGSDAVLRTKCTISGCTDRVCRNNRARAAQNYIREHNIIISTDGKPVTDSAALTEYLIKARKELVEHQQKVLTLTSIVTNAEQALEKAKAKELDEREAKEAYLAEQRQTAITRVLGQLETLSPQRVAQLVVEAGLDRLGPVGATARGLLQEGYDTLLASYWIKGKETDVYAIVESPWSKLESAYSTPPAKYKAVKSPDGYSAITGVCSVGALALSKAVLNDIPVTSFTLMAEGDRGMAIATQALSWAISAHHNWSNGLASSKAPNKIVNWNDADKTERDEVLEVWKLALNCPFLDLPDDGELYYITSSDNDVSFPGIVFATTTQAYQVILELQLASTETPSGFRIVGEKLTSPQAKAIVKALGNVWNKKWVRELAVRTIPLPEPTLTKV